jgi:hypothetical protein
MVIRDFHGEGIWLLPVEANPVLLIDPDGILTLSILRKQLQLVAGEDSQIGQHLRRIDLQQLSPRHTRDGLESFRELPVEDLLGFGVSK